MRIGNILNLGVTELRGLVRNPMMVVLIGYAFTLGIYIKATAMPETLNRAPIAIVDENPSPLSLRIIGAFYPPRFLPPVLITRAEMDARMDAGVDTFALDIPVDFQRDVLAGRQPTIQLNVDATRMTQAYTGSGYIQTIVDGELNTFAAAYRANPGLPVDLAMRVRFNQTLNLTWFAALHRARGCLTHRRARVRHDRASTRHAGHALRDHDEQGMVHGSGGAGRLRVVAGFCRARTALHAN